MVLWRIFHRYAHETLQISSGEISLDEGLRIDNIKLQDNRIFIFGWSCYDEVGVKIGNILYWAIHEKCSVRAREDELRQFNLSIPFQTGDLFLTAKKNTTCSSYRLRGFSWSQVQLARLKLIPGYVYSLISAIPSIYRWKFKGDLVAKQHIKSKLRLIPKTIVSEIDPSIFDNTAATSVYQSASLVMPIFNALDYLKEALLRIERNSDIPLHIILIEDCSTDPNVRTFVSEWTAQKRRFPVTLLLNDKNLGFVKSANRGIAKALETAPGLPVILLNSDAMVPAGWVSRLLAPLSDPKVASVTPMSNDAEIFNVPVICQRFDLAEGLVDRIDNTARKLKAVSAPAPTGVGFCMALAPRFLAVIPGFDTAFGLGYGEENDWCQKTLALGGVHLGIGNLFVEHRGGSSFGSEAKRRLIERNNNELRHRYPNYPQMVNDFIKNDPLISSRLALGLTWAANSSYGPIIVWIAHSLGGGANIDLNRRIQEINSRGQTTVVIRVGSEHRWLLELHSPFGVTQAATNDFNVVSEMISLLPERHVIYSCGVGARDAASLPHFLAAIAGYGPNAIGDKHQNLEILFHDFFPLSPSYTLLGSDGVYHGVSADLVESTDKAHIYNTGDNSTEVNLKEWRSSWHDVASNATSLTVFSRNSAEIVSKVWPDLEAKISIRPHSLVNFIPKINISTSNSCTVVGVLGNIGHHKGAKVISSLSRSVAKSKDMKVVVIGQLDPDYKLHSPSLVHGHYEPKDLPALVAQYGINAWFIPSIWPETFSFTTHEALATGMPVFVFDVGAQADAVRHAIQNGQGGAVFSINRAMSLNSYDFLENLK